LTNFYSRWQYENLAHALKTRRVILLSGPRQCGKTTLTKQLTSTNSEIEYRTLDNQNLRELAASDPHGFLIHPKKTLIIDEVQRVPSLLTAIKMAVDQDTRPGQFLLTGSANIQSLPATQESLAGRIRKLRLRPLSQGEILGIKPTFLDKAFVENFSNSPSNQLPKANRQIIIETALKGGYPEALLLTDRERKRWYLDYAEALIERDLIDIAQINRRQSMQELVRCLAAWSSKNMDVSAIGSGLAISRPTIETYINALEALYLVEKVNPWIQTDYERVGKQQKLFMTDCGLMSSLLGWSSETLLLDSDRSGKLVETFVFNELAAQIDACDMEYRIFHYRDREKREIDFLIEREDQSLLGIEVKAGSTISQEHFKHLKWFKNHLAGKRPFIGIVLYSGEDTGSMGDRLWAVPITKLWSP
jgi:predicted AAA+ superfamily ATPase